MRISILSSFTVAEQLSIVLIDTIWQVCELDIIFNFEKAYFMLDEFIIGGEVQETSKKNVLKAIAAQDLMQEVQFYYCPGSEAGFGNSFLMGGAWKIQQYNHYHWTALKPLPKKHTKH
jgi:hypothetical protein